MWGVGVTGVIGKGGVRWWELGVSGALFLPGQPSVLQLGIVQCTERDLHI